MGVSNPSARGYAKPVYGSNKTNTREYFGGNSKAGLGSHIGMGQFVRLAIVNGAAGSKATTFAGPNFSKIYAANNKFNIYLNSASYPISNTNQLSGGPGHRENRSSADGVNLENRKKMQTMVNHWNKVWPALPIRDTPNSFVQKVPFNYYV
tara:strand:- start:818 stop:1270 length:453 start_codon:yes stop_codon:yes gene_type:complete